MSDPHPNVANQRAGYRGFRSKAAEPTTSKHRPRPIRLPLLKEKGPAWRLGAPATLGHSGLTGLTTVRRDVSFGKHMSQLQQSVRIRAAGAMLDADLVVPDGAAGLVVFAPGSGRGRPHPRNHREAERQRAAGC